MGQPRRKYLILTIISVSTVLLDQVTKYWAQALKTRPSITIIEHFFHLRYAENRGAAWGLFSGMEEDLRIPFFILISFLAIGFIVYFFKMLKDNQYFLIVALSFILGGAVGNFIDRMAYNYVIDFIDWHYYHLHWPTFNVADAFISVGVGMLMFEMLFGKSELSLFHSPKVREGEASSASKDRP